MDDQVTDRQEAAIRRRQTLRVVTIAAVVALAAALAADNRRDVRLGYLVGDREAPLVLALVAAFALGAIAGALARRSRSR